MIAASCDHEPGWQAWDIIPDCFPNKRKLARCNRRSDVSDAIEHLSNVLPLDMVFLDLGHGDVEYVPNTSLKKRF